jgi:glucokinase
MSLVAAIDVGGTAAKTAVMDENRTVKYSSSVPLEHLRGKPEMAATIVEICRATVRRAEDIGGAQAVGLIVPGIVDPAARRGVSSMLLGWRDVPFGDLVQDACNLPTAVDHDVRSAARAEFHYGNGTGISDALFVTVGTGIGAAALIGGEIRTGAHGNGGEIAHIVVDPDGPPCPCGKRGCVETMASGPAIAAAYRAGGGRTADAKSVAAAARNGDPLAAAVWGRAAGMLGRAIAIYSQILDPAMVILAGGVAAAGEQLVQPIRRAVAAQVSSSIQPQVVLSGLGGIAGVHGAAMIALELMAGSS